MYGSWDLYIFFWRCVCCRFAVDIFGQQVMILGIRHLYFGLHTCFFWRMNPLRCPTAGQFSDGFIDFRFLESCRWWSQVHLASSFWILAGSPCVNWDDVPVLPEIWSAGAQRVPCKYGRDQARMGLDHGPGHRAQWEILANCQRDQRCFTIFSSFAVQKGVSLSGSVIYFVCWKCLVPSRQSKTVGIVKAERRVLVKLNLASNLLAFIEHEEPYWRWWFFWKWASWNERTTLAGLSKRRPGRKFMASELVLVNLWPVGSPVSRKMSKWWRLMWRISISRRSTRMSWRTRKLKEIYWTL